MPAWAITYVQRATSSRTATYRVAPGLENLGTSRLIFCEPDRHDGLLSFAIARVSPLRLNLIAAARVAAGTDGPVQALTSKSRQKIPDSADVRMSAPPRSAPLSSPRSRAFDRSSPKAAHSEQFRGPSRRVPRSGPAPQHRRPYTAAVQDINLRILHEEVSRRRLNTQPTPADAKLSLPGFFRA